MSLVLILWRRRSECGAGVVFLTDDDYR